MFSKRERNLTAAVLFWDGLIAAVALLMAITLGTRGTLEGWVSGDIYRVAALAAIISPFALRWGGAYTSGRSHNLRDVLAPLLPGTAMSATLLLTIGVAFRGNILSASIIGLYAAVQLVALVIQRIIIFRLLPELRKRGYNGGSFVVVGSGPRARQVADTIASNPSWGLRSRGFLDDAPRPRDLEVLGDSYIGRTKELSDLFTREVIDEVFVVLPRQYLCADSTVELINLCETVGVDVTIVSDLFQTRRARPEIHDLLGPPGITLANYPHRLWKVVVKRVIDIVGALAGILLTSPLCLVAALAIKLGSPGPVFFVQRRCGLRGRTFPFIKFRTMYVDAEARLGELRQYNETTGPVFKMKHDPRVTRVGQVLRKYSIDELPQLVNVLLGHMSLVGPRPPIPDETTSYDLSERRRLSVRPGLTCLWQISGRSQLSFEEWMRLDLEYIDNWSLWLDLRILLRTIPAVIRGDGAS